MRLYDFELSGNCYKVRLLLGMLGLKYERVPVDSSKGETQTPAFKTLNPRGQIPVLEDGEVRLWDSLAILVYRPPKPSPKRPIFLDSWLGIHRGVSPTSMRSHLPPGILAPRPESLRQSCSWA